MPTYHIVDTHPQVRDDDNFHGFDLITADSATYVADTAGTTFRNAFEADDDDRGYDVLERFEVNFVEEDPATLDPTRSVYASYV